MMSPFPFFHPFTAHLTGVLFLYRLLPNNYFTLLFDLEHLYPMLSALSPSSA